MADKMSKIKQILLTSMMLIMLSACAFSTKTELSIPVTDFQEPTIVIDDGLSRIQLIETFRSAGWEVLFSGALAGENEAEKLLKYRMENEIEETPVKQSVANYMAFVAASPKGLCTDLQLGEAQLYLDSTVGISPHYTQYSIRIYDVRTSRSVFSVRAGGCENKVMNNVRKELARLVTVSPDQSHIVY